MRVLWGLVVCVAIIGCDRHGGGTSCAVNGGGGTSGGENCLPAPQKRTAVDGGRDVYETDHDADTGDVQFRADAANTHGQVDNVRIQIERSLPVYKQADRAKRSLRGGPGHMVPTNAKGRCRGRFASSFARHIHPCDEPSQR